jgi:hypothetical protein
MSELVRVYDARGCALAELDVSPTVSWRLNGIGRCEFEVARTDPNFREEYLRPGNYLTVEYDNGLPDWVGVIDTDPRGLVWRMSGLDVTAYEAAQMLKWRSAAEIPLMLDSSAGNIFLELLRLANAPEDLLLRPGTVWLGGPARQETLKSYLYDHLENISDRSGCDWQFTPARDLNNALVIQGHWLERAGVDSMVDLDEATNLARKDKMVRREGRIGNQYIGLGDASTSNTRLKSIQTNAESVALYRLRQMHETFYGNSNQGTLDNNTATAVARMSSPRDVLDIEAYNQNNLFGALRLGNRYAVRLYSQGWNGGEPGWNGIARLHEMEYSQQDGLCALTLLADAD